MVTGIIMRLCKEGSISGNDQLGTRDSHTMDVPLPLSPGAGVIWVKIGSSALFAMGI